ncbi:MAG: hypothetical protein ABIJ00_01375 [Candidatus Eisenbacteria bacterium]
MNRCAKANTLSGRAGVTGAITLAGMFLAIGLLPMTVCLASFEIDPVSPAERGAATRLALGRVEGTHSVLYGDDWGSAGSGSVRCYGFKPFGMSEIDFGAIWVSVQLGDETHQLSTSYQRLKVLSYVEETFLISHGFRLGRLRCLPVVRLGTVKFDGEQMDMVWLCDLGLATDVRDNMTISVGLKNPLALGLSESGDMFPTSITLGLGFPVAGCLGWGIEVQKESGHQTCIATGVEWSFAGGLVLRTGLRTYPQEFCLGVGLRLGHGMVDVAASVVPDLGATHEFGGAWTWD